MPWTVEHIVEKPAAHGIDQALADTTVHPKVDASQCKAHEQHECENAYKGPEVALHLVRGNIDNAFAHVDEQQTEHDAQEAKHQTQEEPETKSSALFVKIS